MMSSVNRRSGGRLALVALALGLCLGTAGCESMDALNPFSEKEKKLPGARVPVFPEGVPGVTYGAPVQQPASPGQLPPAAAPSEGTPSPG